jgi:hypothetical protein
MLYGAILFHKYGRKSAKDNEGQSYPTPSRGNTYAGAPVPRPEFVDLEDGQGTGFQKKPNMQQGYP